MSENKAPKKIYLPKGNYDYLCNNGKYTGCYTEKGHETEVCFILESEHLRMTSEHQSEVEMLKETIDHLNGIIGMQTHEIRQLLSNNDSLKVELSTSNDLLKMTSDISEHRLTQVTELKKHLQLLLASMDGELDAKRMEYGESYPESAHSKKAKEYLKSIK